MTQTQFKLNEGLEALVGAYSTADAFSEQAEKGMKPQLVDGARRFYGELNQAGISQVDPNLFGSITHYDFVRTMRVGKANIATKLEAGLDENTYKAAKAYYLGSLNEVKPGFYVNVLAEGAMPKLDANANDADKAKYDLLKKAGKEAALAKGIEKAVEDGDMQTARSLVAQNLNGATVEYLSIIGGYAGSNFENATKRIYLDVANQARERAAKSIIENKLTGLIEKGMDERLGKAKSLVEMYKAYQGQLQYNKDKEAEAKAKAKKK